LFLFFFSGEINKTLFLPFSFFSLAISIHHFSSPTPISLQSYQLPFTNLLTASSLQ
jgi:hypothetical protein